jgi:hypothetical protein
MRRKNSAKKDLTTIWGVGYKNINKGYLEMKKLFSGKIQLILTVLLGLLGLLILPTPPAA